MSMEIRVYNSITLCIINFIIVAPSVRAPSQLLGAPLDSDVHLECVVEASPAAVTYWLKGRATAYASQEEDGLREDNDVAGQLLERKPEMLLDGYVNISYVTF